MEAAGTVADTGDEAAAVRAIRGRRDATCRVAARLVRDGGAGAFVTTAGAQVALAAATFGLGLLPGTTHGSLLVRTGGYALVDAGASADPGPGMLVQHAVQGSAALRALGQAAPVRLLAATRDPEVLDVARRAALDGLRPLAEDGLIALGPPAVPRDAVAGPDGPPAVTILTDGFTGSVLRAALGARGGVAMLVGFRGVGVQVASDIRATGAADAASALAADVAAGIAAARTAAGSAVVPAVADALERLVARRRAAAGLGAGR